MQIGKNGVTENFLATLETAFKNKEGVRISVLKSAGHEHEKVVQMAEEIVNVLGKKFTYKIVGFTIVVHKWRKERR